MFSNRGFTLVEAVVAMLIAMGTVLALGALGERMIHHRASTDSNSAAMSLAERRMEKLRAIPCPPPPTPTLCDPSGGQCPAGDLCGGAPPNGLTHGPTNIDINGNAEASGPYRIQWVVVDANTDSNQSPLVLPADLDVHMKKITVTVTHVSDPNVRASVVTYYKAN